MLLSSIQVQGFKSFADKTVLKFGRGITAVVGPNGSGKSNISDAVRWVLGEQSTKSLRGQSMEDVIFGGTEARRPHGFCEVTLNIDNTDRTLNFDNDYVSITRRYYRSHESEYAINGVNVRLKDIHELFMDTGLGRDGYSMIGQGKIDNIISSKSGERRDIFEEAAGISKYRYRKIEAERKLIAAEDNLLRLHDILDELKSRVGPLKEQSAKAQKFLDFSDEKKKLEIGLWLYTLNNSKETLRNQENKIALAQLNYREIEKELEEYDRKTEENTAYFARLTSEIEGERLTISSTNEEIVKLGGEISVIENSISFNTESIARLEVEKSNLSKTDTEANEEIRQKEKEIEKENITREELSRKLAALEGELSTLLSDSDTISRKIENQIRELNILSQNIADLRVEMVTANTACEDIVTRASVLAEQKRVIEDNLSSLNTEYSETDNLLKQLNETENSSKNILKGFEIKFAGINEKIADFKTQSDTLNLDLEAKKRRIQILKDLENNMEGFGFAVKTVMSQSKTGVLKGICGTVSQLINVESKYSIAIETALGNAIQNVVTETEADAKHAINYLKNNKGGRATFLPVATIKAREFDDVDYEGMFGFIGNAADLVKCDNKYREIVKFLLSGTVIAEDIDSATKIAKKFGYKFKIVTLDGQIINVGGSLTGGSLVKHSGILSRSNDIKTLEAEVEKIISSLETVNEKLNASISDASKIDAEITSIKAELTIVNEDKIRSIAELKRIEELISNANNSKLAIENEENTSGNRLTSLKEKSAILSEKIGQLDEQKASLQAEIDEMTGGRDTISTRRDALSQEITAVKLSVIETEKDMESLITSKEAILNLISSREKRALEIEGEIKELELKNVSLNSTIADANGQIIRLKDKIKQGEQSIADMLQKRNETEKSGVELRSGEREKTSKREQINGELARLIERKEVMMREYDEVIAKLFDEYQLTRTEAEALGYEIEKPSDAKKTLAEIKSKIRNLGNVNVSAIEEYKEVSERFEFLSAQVEDVEKTRSELYKLINQLTTQMKDIFRVEFQKISDNFSKTFVELFGGGSANLSLSDPDNILESGIDINVKLPGKSVPSLDGLSGGEKALIALSLYFAIMRVSAPPFCFLDEVDTALDDINVDRFADYMKKSDFATQFICVTHRRGTMEAADMLYGVTMQEKGVTKLLELNVSELEKKLDITETA